MNKIRPLIISRTIPYLGGREIMVNAIIKSFSKNNKVWVLTPDKYRDNNRINAIHNTNCDNNLIKKLKQAKIDLVNCHTFYFFGTALKIAEALNIPLIFTLHGVFVGMYGKKYNSIIRKISERSTLVVTVSEAYLNKLKKTFPVYTRKFIKIQNGVGALKPEHEISPCIKYVVIPARINKVKGLEYVAKAAKQFKNIKFCICYPSGRENNIVEIKYKNKLIQESENLLFFKKLNHKKMLLEIRKADLILLPSLIEGISISILESMSLGKIVAATRVGGNPEIIKNNMNGFLFRPKSAGSIVEVLNKISKITIEDKKNISKNAILTVKSKFGINRMLKKYKYIFNLVTHENKQ